MDAAIQVAIATGIGAGLGALVGNIFAVINEWRNRAAINKRTRRELAVRAAIEYWKTSIEYAKMQQEAGKNVSLSPFDSYLVPMIALFDGIGEADVNAANVGALIDGLHAAARSADEKSRAYSEAAKKA